MRAFKPFAAAVLSLAFTAATAAYALPLQVQETTTSTSTSSSSPAGTTAHHHTRRTTVHPDGTTTSASHTETDKSGATIDPATGQPAVVDEHHAQKTESVTTPDGSNATTTESHSTTSTQTPPQ